MKNYKRTIELSKKDLNGKGVIDYLNNNYKKVEKMRGYLYKINDKWITVLTDEDIRMNEIIRKSFSRCFYGGKLSIDTSSIKERIDKYLEDNKDIDSEKYSKKDNRVDSSIIDDRIYDLLSYKKWDLMDYIGL